MSGLVFSNFASTTLSGSITNTALSIQLSAGSGALFPQLTGTQYFIGTLTDAATRLQHEIVRVTAISGDTVTVVRGQENTTAQNWSAGDYFQSIPTAGTLATFNQNIIAAWDLSNPPTTDVFLNPGDIARITFESVTSVPLTIRTTTQALYLIYFSVTGNNSTNSDTFLFPNNTSYSNAFSRYSIQASDTEITSFGGATSDPNTTPLTGGVATYSALFPQNAASTDLSTFFIDLFLGPSAYDSINERGPFLLEFLANTTTAAKMIKTTGAIIGGAHVASSLWADTVTAWTSLGSISVSLSGSGGSSGPMATISGMAVVERII